MNYFSLGFITATTVGKVMLCAVAGMFISKYFLEKEKSEKGLTYITTKILLPCLLFSNLCLSVEWSSVSLYYWAPLIALLPVALGVVLSFLAKPLLPKEYQALLMLAGGFQNGLTFPLSIVLNLKGVSWFGAAESTRAQSYMFLYNIVCAIALFAVGEPVIIYYRNKELEEERLLQEAVANRDTAGAREDAIARHVNDSFAYPYESPTSRREAGEAPVVEAGPDGKRAASTVEQMRWYRPAQASDAPIRALNADDGTVTGPPAESSVHRWARMVKGALVSPPVFASLVALCISLTPPLRWLAESFCGQILVGGLSLVGGGAIPVQLLVLGLTVMSKRQVAPAPPPADAATAAAEDADGEVVVVKTKRTLLQKAQNSMPPQALFTFVAIVIRLLMVPSVCFIVIHLLNRAGLLPNDSSFLLSMLLETASPSAINSSLICAIHSFHTQEYTRMIFVMYMTAVVTTTIWLFFDILYVQSYYQ
ncbi:transporter [Strigomonas culicis]|uniref:Transporter n=1 Tax=Strigomonas culicis TaxID=28005 RepID=S9UL30_9TRYP|nr:transporter [Strigomonas culicis]|eukprot:EPY29613.1 transporter [Strigomonas culicis]